MIRQLMYESVRSAMARGTFISMSLRGPTAAELPSADPGAHIDVTLTNGITRQYSLLNSGPSPRCYVIGVKRDPVPTGS
jgi:vanillate monooxygenase ferredoxin subunit